MAIPNIFSLEVTQQLIERINKLTPSTAALWGKMNVGQMLAHCSVTYEMLYEDKHKKPGGFMRWMLKTMVKPGVVNEKPYKHSLRTAPAFIIVGEKELEAERSRLIGYLRRTQALGAQHFEGKESNSFGNLTSQEWNNMFYKHLDHHLSQFGV